MQIHEEALRKDLRPSAPGDCASCSGSRKLHCHGSYERNADCEGEQKIRVLRFICPRCNLTISVIPRGMFPYRSLRVERFEVLMDAEHGFAAQSAGEGARPPPASEVEKGCVRRAMERLAQRISFLSGLLGQRMPVLAHNNIRGFLAGAACNRQCRGKIGRFG